MAKIYAPMKDYTGETVTVLFSKGVGETSDPYLINWFKSHGYAVVENEVVEDEDTNNEEVKITRKRVKKADDKE
ncbi:hypothetical protein [Dialister micraerophilus]|uniref:hypothetical protein n=1 Tax=Dialister micraerophilus TaxID=309120 RepID=UPI0023F575A0|nr:hypothetical protein [Dialister micraerophilus]